MKGKVDASVPVQPAIESERLRLNLELLKGNHCHSILCAAATRIEELVIQKHLRVTRADMWDMEICTVARCEETLELWRQAPTVVENNKRTATLLASIEAALPAIRAELAAIESDPDVKAGIASKKVRYLDVVDYHTIGQLEDPGDDPHTWATLGDIAAFVCLSANNLRTTKAMLRQYVALRSTVSTELCPRDAALVTSL